MANMIRFLLSEKCWFSDTWGELLAASVGGGGEVFPYNGLYGEAVLESVPFSGFRYIIAMGSQ